LQPKGWIKKHTITAEHKVKTIMQYNKNINTFIEHQLLQNYSKSKVMINSIVNKRCLKACCTHMRQLKMDA